MGQGRTVTLTVSAGTAKVVVELLELLSDLPSTPQIVRHEAREHAASLEERMPVRPRQTAPGARDPGGPVELEPVAVTAIAGMLDLLAGLPSTPPAVSDEARSHAEAFWDAVNAADAETGSPDA